MKKKNALVPEKHRLDPETIQRPLSLSLSRSLSVGFRDLWVVAF